LTVSAGAAERS